MKLKDLTGIRFGKLLVIGRIPAKGPITWKCKCDCGNTKNIIGIYLTGKRGYKCCGCEKKLKSAYKQVINQYKQNAVKRNLIWDLSDEIFVYLIKQDCIYCGIGPRNLSYRNKIKYNGIDRLENTKGYFVENCVPCCSWCNKGKMNKTVNEFVEWINLVHKNLQFNPIQQKE